MERGLKGGKAGLLSSGAESNEVRIPLGRAEYRYSSQRQPSLSDCSTALFQRGVLNLSLLETEEAKISVNPHR